jgi:hypothetical protein
MRKLMLAVLAWTVIMAVYTTYTGAIPAVQMQNCISSFLFIAIASIWLWVLPLKRRPRLISLGVSVLLASLYFAWQITRLESLKGVGLYALCSVVSLITISVTLGMLLLIVELLDYLLSLLERRRALKASGGTRHPGHDRRIDVGLLQLQSVRDYALILMRDGSLREGFQYIQGNLVYVRFPAK